MKKFKSILVATSIVVCGLTYLVTSSMNEKPDIVAVEQIDILESPTIVKASQPLPSASLENPPEAIKIAQMNGIELIERFDTPLEYDGWVVKNKRDYNIWYSNKAGYVFVGALLDPEGINLTAQFYSEKVPKKDHNAIFDGLTVIKANPDANSDMPIYVFYEPFCGYCSVIHVQLQSYIDRGADVRWVPVAFLRKQQHKAKDGIATSEELVARMLGSANPLEVMLAHESDKEKQGGRGGLTVGVKPTEDLYAKMRFNSEVMRDFGFTGTPATFYIDKDGELKKLRGAKLLDKWSDLFGLKRMDSDDKRLSGFSKPLDYPVK
jgi:thiol:disulfide interchange protein DsbG